MHMTMLAMCLFCLYNRSLRKLKNNYVSNNKTAEGKRKFKAWSNVMIIVFETITHAYMYVSFLKFCIKSDLVHKLHASSGITGKGNSMHIS